MPLTWDITRCADTDAIKTDQEWPVTEACIFLTVGIGIGDWTEANAPEVFGRISLMEKLYGAMVRVPGPEGLVDRYLTPEDVRRRIGLRTNVGKPETRASFIKRHCASVVTDAMWKYQSAERNRLATHPHPLDGTHAGLARDCEVCAAESDDEITREGRALAATGTV